MKKVTTCILTILLAIKCHAQKCDTFLVHFDLNNSGLNKRASDFIDKLIFNDVLIHGQKLILFGFADYLGGNAHNDSLSSSRAKTVENYLIDAGFDPKDITLCIGKGKIERVPTGKAGYSSDRKVQIIIDCTAHKNAPPGAVMDVANAKVNQIIVLKHIFFQGGLPDILPSSLPELDTLWKTMVINKSLKIQIEGHICCMGLQEGVDDNNLSEYRAKAVYDYLVSKGIDKTRMKYIGLGNSNPIVKEEITEDDREQNRRVEIRIISK